jgi:hypothetical protein
MWSIACNDTTGRYFYGEGGVLVGRGSDAQSFKHRESVEAYQAMLDARVAFRAFKFSGRPYWCHGPWKGPGKGEL